MALYGWGWRKSHVINGTADGAQTNYQVRITVHKGAGADGGEHVYLNGECRDDFGDIRFIDSDGETELDYWMQEYISGDKAVFWVEIPNIPASPNTVSIYIYFDKPTATTTSNGNATFPLFDHFEGTTLDPVKWYKIQGTIVVSGSVLKLVGVSPTEVRIRSNMTFNAYRRIHSRLRWSKADLKSGHHIGFEDYAPYHPNGLGTMSIGVANKIRYYVRHGGLFYSSADTPISTPTAYHIWSVKWFGNSQKAEFYEDDTLWGTYVTNACPDKAHNVPANMCGTSTVDHDVFIDWTFVRKCTDIEPTHGAWGPAVVPLSILNLYETLNVQVTMIEPSDAGGYNLLGFWVRKLRAKYDKILFDDHNIPRAVLRLARDIVGDRLG